jgi:hypothetical protein
VLDPLFSLAESILDRLFALAEKCLTAVALAAGVAIERCRRLKRPTQPAAVIPLPPRQS